MRREGETRSLTGVRFVAAAAIALAHLGGVVTVMGFPLRDLAVLGMPIFFTLSGFIIHYAYSDLLNRGQGRGEFAVARFCRLWPLYICFLLYCLVHYSAFRDPLMRAPWPVALTYVTLTFSWLPLVVEGIAPIQQSFGISWSISTEIFFYVCYALALFRIGQIRSVPAAVVALLIFCLLAIAFFTILYFTSGAWEGFALAHGVMMPARAIDPPNSFFRWFLYVSPYCRIFEFVGGCLSCQVAFLLRERGVSAGAAGWLTTAGALVLLGTFALYERFMMLTTPISIFGDIFTTLHLNFLFAPGCYLLYVGLALGDSRIGRVFGSPVCWWLGTISYSIYLCHPIASQLAPVDAADASKGYALILAALITLALARSTYVAIERPGQTVLRQALLRLFYRSPEKRRSS